MSNNLYYYSDNNISCYYLMILLYIIKDKWEVKVVNIDTFNEERLDYNNFKKNTKIIEFTKAEILSMLKKKNYIDVRIIKYNDINVLLYNNIYYILRNWKDFFNIIKDI